MPRSGLLAALLICCSPLWAEPQVLVALDGRIDTPDSTFVEPPPGQDVSVTLQSLRTPENATAAQELCAAIRQGAFSGETSFSVDPDRILATLVDRGFCRDQP